jgi:hypothetical protein
MLNEKQVLDNVKICIECGIEKVFIINHVVTVGELIGCANRVKELNSDLWVGINMLGVSTKHALIREFNGYDGAISGLWCDESVSMGTMRKFPGMFFGGLAFKYQPQPADLKAACEEAALTTDVATTSGTGTGKAADIIKIRRIREYLGNHPMAIASGISAENINQYKDIVDYLLVASSITTSDRSEMIIKDKLIELKSKL